MIKADRKTSEIELYREILSGKLERICLYLEDDYIGSISIIDKNQDFCDYDINIEYDDKSQQYHMHIWFNYMGCHYHFDSYELFYKNGADRETEAVD